MNYVNGILVFIVAIVAVAMKGRVPPFWPWSAFALITLMYFIGLSDRQKLSEDQQGRLKGKGYIPGITSSLSNGSARLFCTLLIWWLAGLLGWVLLHYHSQPPELAN
jgi:hypothetical protein